uniref:Uncharacterized protein n=1 Tax=Caenorhabditis japonica TaxID=281687 RepID=A0A8R1HJD3_CAEJA
MMNSTYRTRVMLETSSDESDSHESSENSNDGDDELRAPRQVSEETPADESMCSVRSTSSSRESSNVPDTPTSQSNHTGSFATSTPKSKSTSLSRVEASSYGSSIQSSTNDRSRSFIDEEKPMTPITKKLSEASDSKSKQKLRERLLRKTLKQPAPLTGNSNSSGGWGSSPKSPDAADLFTATFSPIVKTEAKKHEFQVEPVVTHRFFWTPIH